MEGIEVPRVMLHARTLGFHHPSTGEFQEYTKAFPSDMEQVVQALDGLTPPHNIRKSCQAPQLCLDNAASKDEGMQTADVRDARCGCVYEYRM